MLDIEFLEQCIDIWPSFCIADFPQQKKNQYQESKFHFNALERRFQDME